MAATNKSKKNGLRRKIAISRDRVAENSLRKFRTKKESLRIYRRVKRIANHAMRLELNQALERFQEYQL